MESSEFVDYYEVLEISPNANSGTIERMFRYFAQRYHPDNPQTGDRNRFDVVLEAHNTLRDPVKRAQYDIQYKINSGILSKLTEDASDSKSIDRDAGVQNRLLSILYVKRRQNVRDPGLGDVELERLLDSPSELLEFHIWFLKEKGWIERTEDGRLAITAEGVDHVNTKRQSKPNPTRLIEERRTGREVH
jgi:curved DNA-binding protein CbpA